MPSIRIWTDPNLTELRKDARQHVMQTVRFSVADFFHLSDSDVEVLFTPVVDAINAASINVEILFSTSEDLHPDKDALGILNQEIIQVVKSLDYELPEDFVEIGVWSRPQHGAVFSLERHDTL